MNKWNIISDYKTINEEKRKKEKLKKKIAWARIFSLSENEPHLNKNWSKSTFFSTKSSFRLDVSRSYKLYLTQTSCISLRQDLQSEFFFHNSVEGDSCLSETIRKLENDFSK